MNIYFVNRNSKLKGPFDIIDSNRQHIIRVGDICLRDNDEGVAFLVVTGANNSWNACKEVGIGEHDLFAGLGNTLLLSFDGLRKRKGDVALIKQLLNCYREKVIVDFFNNAIDILEYQKDFWDMSLFQRFFAVSQELITRNEVTKLRVLQDSKKYPSVFAKYLDEDLLDLLEASLNDGYGLKEAYMILRENEPMQFRAALMKFLAENPTGTIYDKLSIEAKTAPQKEESIIETKSPVEDEIQRENIADDDVQSFLLSDISSKEFKQLLYLYRNGEKKALGQLVIKNLKLVRGIACKYEDQGVEFDDLVQEGVIGLMRALLRYNPNRNVQFPLYAQWWINRALKDAIRKYQSMLKIPTRHVFLHKKVQKHVEQFEQEFGYKPSSSDIVIEDDLSPSEIDFYISLPNKLHELTISYNAWDEYMSDEPETDYPLIKESVSHVVNCLLGKLKPREAQVLRFLYGIGVKKESLSEIGERMGLTNERIRQISEKAVRKLKEIVKNQRKSISIKSQSIETKVSDNPTSTDIQTNYSIQQKVKKESPSSLTQNERDNQDVRLNNHLFNTELSNQAANGEKRIKAATSFHEIDTPAITINESEIEHIYIDMPSAEHCTEIRRESEPIVASNIKSIEVKNPAIEPDKLKMVFDKKASSYKFFWFMSLISLTKESGHLSHTYKDITIRMVALAWPIVIGDDVELGGCDMMKNYLKEVSKTTFLISASTGGVVERCLQQNYHTQGIDKILAPLMKNVPYRFLSPWIKYTSDEEVVAKSCSQEFDGLYSLRSDSIYIHKEWWDYIDAHYQEICDFALHSFIEYTKKYNSDIKLIKLMTNGWPQIRK